LIQPKEMSDMYNALNEDYMFQESKDRAATMRANRQQVAARAGRRWWRKASHRTG
jgi:hypothetical protein